MSLTNLNNLADYGVENEEELVAVLKDRFSQGQYYVNTGNLLVAINSWKTQTTETLDSEILEYIDYVQNLKDPAISYPIGLSPSPFSIGEKALRDVQKSSVSIMPLGKSGSGKSYIVESILNYFTFRCPSDDKCCWKDDIPMIVYISNLFCNAKTLLCDNSTRSMKLYELLFDHSTNSIEGVKLRVSLLDKFRVVGRIANEDNFNIFNTFLNELHSSQTLEKYFLDGNHRYVQLKIDDNSFHNNNKSLVDVLSFLDFSQEEINGVFSLLAAIILLGDIEFGQAKKAWTVLNYDLIQKVADLFGIPPSKVHTLLFTITEDVKGKKIKIKTSYYKLIYQRDCLAVVLYERLVNLVMSKINNRNKSKSPHSILLCDIFGWENYNVNFYEQLVINTSNEAVQSFYNTVMFRRSQMIENEVCFSEKSLRPEAVHFLFKHKGLLNLLHKNVGNETTKSDKTLLKRMKRKFKKEELFEANKMGNAEFLIHHFFDKVSYDVTGFLAKCRCLADQEFVISSFQGSTNPVLNNIFSQTDTILNRRFANEVFWSKTELFLTHHEKKKGKTRLVNSNVRTFTIELCLLFERLLSTKIHFIRCINSNISQEPLTLDDDRLLSQVKCANFLPTLQHGNLTITIELSDFLSRYKVIFFDLLSNDALLNISKALIKSYSADHFRVSDTMIFMSEFLINDLESRRDQIIHNIILVQKIFRGIRGRRHYKELLKMKFNYEQQCSSFLTQVSNFNTKFYKHLELQALDDQERLKKRDQTVEYPNTSKEKENENRRVTWCKVICFQRSKQIASFNISEEKIIIDGTSQIFSTNRIDFNSFETPIKDIQMAKVKRCIGKGVEFFKRDNGSLIAKRLCKNAIFIKGHYCEDELVEKLGELEKMQETVIFDYELFEECVNYQCHPSRIGAETKDHCLASCAVHVCFIKNSSTDEGSPCWVELVLTNAIDFVQNTVEIGLEKRRIIQEKCHFQVPPTLKIDSKMESISAKILKLIRPSRYIETVKFKRKAWARKRVKSNPFLYEGISPTNENDEKFKPRRLSNMSVTSSDIRRKSETSYDYDQHAVSVSALTEVHDMNDSCQASEYTYTTGISNSLDDTRENFQEMSCENYDDLPTPPCFYDNILHSQDDDHKHDKQPLQHSSGNRHFIRNIEISETSYDSETITFSNDDETREENTASFEYRHSETLSETSYDSQTDTFSSALHESGNDQEKMEQEISPLFYFLESQHTFQSPSSPNQYSFEEHSQFSSGTSYDMAMTTREENHVIESPQFENTFEGFSIPSPDYD